MRFPTCPNELLDWIDAMAVSDIQMAISDIDPKVLRRKRLKRIDMWKIADAITQQVTGFNTIDLSVEWLGNKREELLETCVQNAYAADLVYNPYRGY